MGVYGLFAVIQGRRFFSFVFAMTVWSDMGLYEVSLFMYSLGFGMGTMLANFYMCGTM